MPALKPRPELFVQTLVRGAKHGISARQAYIAAGYTARDGSADACASKLLKTDKVKQRMEEITRPAVRKTQVSVESLLNELSQTIEDARSAKQHGVVIAALTLSAKLVGLLRERIDVNVEVGGTRDEILDRLERRHGSEAMSLLRAALDKADYSLPVIEKRERREIEAAGRSEADIALEEFRPRN
jgi:phage terminase small subunit